MRMHRRHRSPGQAGKGRQVDLERHVSSDDVDHLMTRDRKAIPNALSSTRVE